MNLLSHQGLLMASAGASDYPSTVIADAPIGWWRLNETITNGGTMVDSSGFGRNGGYSLQSADTAVQPGPSLVNGSAQSYAKAGGFPGGGKVTTFPAITGSYSVEAWFKSGSAQTLQQICSIDQGNRLFQFRLNTGKLEFVNIRGTIVGIQSPGTVNDNARHHAVGTVDSTTSTNNINLYIDGVLVATGSGSSTGSVSNSVCIGCFESQTTNQNYQFIGDLADVAIYAAALTSTQVAAHWNAGK